MSPQPAATEDADEDETVNDEIAALKRDSIAAMYRCVYRLAKELARDHERCPRQSCRRARRCRGTLCVWE